MNALRRGIAVATIPPGEWFTPAETTRILNVSHSAVSNAVKRHSLLATGNGKARKLPRATVEALAMKRAKGAGPETANHYVRAARGFFRWLTTANRIGSNPLESLKMLNTTTDTRRARRELTADELRRVFDAARGSHQLFRGLAGADRYFLYLVAAGTGFRANALANLTPADFDLSEATVTLAARFAKNRRTKIQPLPMDVAEALRDFLVGKPANAPIWGGTWAKGFRAAEMLRIDLKAAGIAYAVEGPDGPEYADFHAFRHSYLTLGGRSGIDLRTLQELAGHSKPELTARYSHRRLYDLAGAVAKMPNLVLPNEAPELVPIPLRMTGTDGDSGVPGVPRGVPTGGIRPHRNAQIGTSSSSEGSTGEATERPEIVGAGADLHRPASTCTSSPRRSQLDSGFVERGTLQFNRLRRAAVIAIFPWNAFLEPKPKPEPVKKERRDPLKTAHYYHSLLSTGTFENRAALARYLGVSRARVTQVLNRLLEPSTT